MFGVYIRNFSVLNGELTEKLTADGVNVTRGIRNQVKIVHPSQSIAIKHSSIPLKTYDIGSNASYVSKFLEKNHPKHREHSEVLYNEDANKSNETKSRSILSSRTSFINTV
jgi:hypothetical protein